MDLPRRLRVICGGRSVVVESQLSWNVLFLRQVAASQLGLEGDRQLVQAGRVLPDLMLLNELQPDEDTCFHLTLTQKSPDESENEPADGTAWRSWRRFFVYCRQCCREKEARLRLHCGRCGSGTFLLPSPAPMAFSFRCVDDSTIDEPHSCIPLPRLRDNWRLGGYHCLACMERISGPILHFPCTPEHCLCLPCFRSYAEEAIQNHRFRLHRQYGWTIACPARCGPDSYLDDPHHFLLLGSDYYSQMKSRGAEALVAHEGGGFCPNRQCGEAWLPGENAGGNLECRACGWKICQRCRDAEHEGDCDAADGAQGEVSSNPQYDVPFRPPSPSSIQSTQTIRAISRRCPGCQTFTERSGGCMHMTCARCSFEWCWICRRIWTSDCQADHWFA